MIERIVLIKLKDECCTDAEREEIARYSVQALKGLLGVRSLLVGTPADEAAAKSWDISITLHFDSLEAAEQFRTDPAHRSYVDDYLRTRMEVIKAWNFKVTPS